MYEIEIREEAFIEIQEAYTWYELQKIGLGEQLLDLLDEYFEYISKYPEHFSLITKTKRAAYIKSYPYKIIFSIIKNTVVVFAVFHTSRNPKVWKRRN